MIRVYSLLHSHSHRLCYCYLLLSPLRHPLYNAISLSPCSPDLLLFAPRSLARPVSCSRPRSFLLSLVLLDAHISLSSPVLSLSLFMICVYLANWPLPCVPCSLSRSVSCRGLQEGLRIPTSRRTIQLTSYDPCPSVPVPVPFSCPSPQKVQRFLVPHHAPHTTHHTPKSSSVS